MFQMNDMVESVGFDENGIAGCVTGFSGDPISHVQVKSPEGYYWLPVVKVGPMRPLNELFR